MSLLPLENPLTRLTVFPNTMNYLGTWSATEQYYANDVVASSLNTNTYILTGRTAILGGGDPSINVDWEEITSSTAGSGVVSVTANPADGIQNTGNAENVVLVSTGVLTINADPAKGIQNTGTAQNPVLINTGVLSVTTTPGSGIDISGSPSDPVISNAGVITLTAQNGCVNTGTATNPIIDVSGVVVSCLAKTAPANGGVVVGGTSANPLFSWAPLASGIATFTVNNQPILVNVPYNITLDSIITLTPYTTATFTGSSWYYQWSLTAIPTQFAINYSAPQIQLSRQVQWALLRV